MIDRVDGNRYYEYTKLKNVSVSDTGEKFSLDHKQDELSSEKERKDREVSGQEKQQAAERFGVKVEISSYGRAAGTSDGQRTNTAKNRADAGQVQSFLASVQEIFRTAIAAVKDFFDKIWNEPKAEETVQAETAGQEREGLQDFSEVLGEQTQAVQEAAPVETAEAFYRNEARLNQAIQPYLRKGDLDQVMNLLTDNGKKTAARNSTLLTYYDRNGRMVEPNASDSQRILYGDRNARKL